MKTREFDLSNYNKYDVERVLREMFQPELLKISCGKVTVTTNTNVFVSGLYQRNEDTIYDVLAQLDDETNEKVISNLVSSFNDKKEKTLKSFDEIKKMADNILFDDKDYLDLLKEFENIYACQAVTMLKDIIGSKTKGKTAKALKYQARQLAITNNPTCD